MPKQSKFFRVAVEGATVDGRVIERNWLEEMASSYNRETYAARVNMEHIRGITADKPFKAYGDVVALKTEEVEIDLDGKKVKKLALFAQIDPTDDLVQINADRQKLYTSIEVNPNFAGTGKAYMMGLAVTDNPASLGTEALQFVAHRKLDKGNHFSAAAETRIEFEEKPSAEPSGAAAMLAAATEFFRNFGKGGQAETPQQPAQPAVPPANDNLSQLSAAIGAGFERLSTAMAAGLSETKATTDALRTELNAVKASIETTDSNSQRRPIGTDQSKFSKTDC